MFGAIIAFALLSCFAMLTALNPEMEFRNPIESLEEKITKGGK